ncbi:LytR/AlgR family response regulator transcription factor [Carboxylicivirga sp. RSCT41]|uniref:LytR/AlgR family response regulator transcription factor n=1 Tax=Carboxylicivirga agarovorans TaxID=3417570 RepID=UPI003D345BD2
MKFKSSNPVYHLVYWFFVLTILTLVFGQKWANGVAAFYFISLLTPIVLGTSYFFNYHLVPNFLLKKKHFRFTLYTLYTIIVSLYLESIVLMYAYVYLGQYSFHPLAPNASDTILLAVILYLLVIMGSILLMLKQIKEKQLLIEMLNKENEKVVAGVLELKVKRKVLKIPFNDIIYIESLSDYIQVHTLTDQLSCKEKISHVVTRLPASFLRIHRSYIVNTQKVTSAALSGVNLGKNVLPVGRSYKAIVKEQLLYKSSKFLIVLAASHC